MAKDKNSNLIGSWAFLIGVLLAIAMGLYSGLSGKVVGSGFTIILVVIGLLVGLLNVTGKESMPFLLSGLVLIISTTFGVGVVKDIVALPDILLAMLTIFIPATIIVAIKNVFSIAKN